MTPRAITIRLAEQRDAQTIAMMSRDFIEAGLGWKYDAPRVLRASDAGRAVFVTSIAARMPRAYWGLYSSSKAALEMMVKCYAAEIEKTPLRVNLFNPNRTRTVMRSEAYPGEDPLTVKTPEEAAVQMLPLLLPECTAHGTVLDATDK